MRKYRFAMRTTIKSLSLGTRLESVTRSLSRALFKNWRCLKWMTSFALPIHFFPIQKPRVPCLATNVILVGSLLNIHLLTDDIQELNAHLNHASAVGNFGSPTKIKKLTKMLELPGCWIFLLLAPKVTFAYDFLLLATQFFPFCGACHPAVLH